MPDLSLTVVLAASVCIRGESVPAQIILRNQGTRPIEQLYTFLPSNEAVELVATPAGAKPTRRGLETVPPPGQYVGGPLSSTERDGVHEHGPDSKDRTTLIPGGQMETKADLLQWLGELPPGDYSVTARYNAKDQILESSPVPLKVLPAKPVVSAVPRMADRHFSAWTPAAWVHAAAEGNLLFYQHQSPVLPRNSHAGIRVGVVREPRQLGVAALSSREVKTGHAYWWENGTLQVAFADATGKTKPFVRPIKPPFGGSILHSALSKFDASVFLPLCNEDRTRLSLGRVRPDGDARFFDVDLAKGVPVGPYACCWEQEVKLHFLWTTPQGRQVWHSTVPLDDPGASGVPRAVHTADEPIVWMDACIDSLGAMAETPMFRQNTLPGKEDDDADDPVPLRLVVWCITMRKDQMVCAAVGINDGRSRGKVTFETKGLNELRVVHSAVRADHHLGVLLADSTGKLYYASSRTGELRTLSEWTGQTITLEQQPGLLSATTSGTFPWVYLRHMDSKEGRIAYLKMEPPNEKEPDPHVHH